MATRTFTKSFVGVLLAGAAGLLLTACPAPTGQSPPANVDRNAANVNLNRNRNQNQNGNVIGVASWQLVLRNQPAAFLSVSGTSASDVYAVGADPNDGRGPVVLHYDGVNWQRLNTGQTGDLWWISDRPIGGALYLAGENGLVLRFDPATGTFERLLAPGGETLFGVWGTSANDLWTVGGNLLMQASSGVIYHFNGMSWTRQDLSTASPNGVPLVFKVWGRSETEVYAVGFFGLILRFNGTIWTRLQSGVAGDPPLLTVHGNDSIVAAVGGNNEGVILEGLDGTITNRAMPGTKVLNGIFIAGTGFGVAAGREAEIAFRNNGVWTVQQTGFTTIRDFHAAWMDDAGGLWAVGGNILSQQLNDGMIAHFGPEPISSEIVGN
jgi:hypothetical protein